MLQNTEHKRKSKFRCKKKHVKKKPSFDRQKKVTNAHWRYLQMCVAVHVLGFRAYDRTKQYQHQAKSFSASEYYWLLLISGSPTNRQDLMTAYTLHDANSEQETIVRQGFSQKWRLQAQAHTVGRQRGRCTEHPPPLRQLPAYARTAL